MFIYSEKADILFFLEYFPYMLFLIVFISFVRISLETLDSDLQWLTTRTRSVEESVQRDTELLQQLDSFLQVIHLNIVLGSLYNVK